MIAVFKREFASYFRGITGYVFGAFLLLFVGIYMVAYNLQGGIANFEYVMNSISFIFLFVVPILTMRVLAEERRQKTDQLLYSLPLTMTEVILGKYAALVAVFALPMGIVCLYPLLLSIFGSVYMPAAYSAIAGFFLLGMALIAIGLFVSSITESQAIAAGVCFVALLFNYLIAGLAAFVPATAFASFAALAVVALLIVLIVYLMTRNSTVCFIAAFLLLGGLSVWYIVNASAFEGLFQAVVVKLSLFEQFYVFVNGVFDLTSVVYLLAVTAVFLILGVQSMEKRRWSE